MLSDLFLEHLRAFRKEGFDRRNIAFDIHPNIVIEVLNVAFAFAITNSEARRAWARAARVDGVGDITISTKQFSHCFYFKLDRRTFKLVPCFGFKTELEDLVIVKPFIDELRSAGFNEDVKASIDETISKWTAAGLSNGCFHTFIVTRFLNLEPIPEAEV